VISRIVLVVGLVVLVSCSKKEEEAPRATGATGAGGGKAGIVNAGLASSQGGMAESAKASLLAQQCSIACGVRPENDPGVCTRKCVAECASATDLAGIDTCAQRIAAP
jgi:hypothetical protein